MGIATFSLLASACPSARDPERSRTRVDLAKDLLSKGQDVAAETELKKALALDPKNEEAHLVYGVLYVTRAARDTDLVEHQNCLAGAEEDTLRKQIDEAMKNADRHFARATELAPDYGEAWMNRAVVDMHFGDWDKAVDHLNQALANAARLSSEALARTNLGWAEFQKKDYAHATTELLQATQLVPNFCLAHYRLAAVFFDRERYDEALTELAPFSPQGDKATACAPVLEAYYLGGQVSLRTHDIEGAVPWFQRCIEAAPRSCMAKQCKMALEELGS